ncbi:hypothetical protein RHS04_00051 [Rhizoctonia solani]|uniref:Uncharacterized protein n=1 Tax=Rhizoctonia solani TaxID=456999 RepID=A0A8H7HGI3_9AGAM|nr:hypothetical protein RHS04_00051 [Rhizoctonia solani]
MPLQHSHRADLLPGIPVAPTIAHATPLAADYAAFPEPKLSPDSFHPPLSSPDVTPPVFWSRISNRSLSCRYRRNLICLRNLPRVSPDVWVPAFVEPAPYRF